LLRSRSRLSVYQKTRNLCCVSLSTSHDLYFQPKMPVRSA